MSRTLIAILFIIGTLIIGVFYAWPQWSQLSGINQTIGELTAVSEQYDNLIKNRDSLLAAINSISKENLDRVDQALPLGSNASEFLVALEAYTVANGIVIKRIDLSSPSAATPPATPPAIPSAEAHTPVPQNPIPSQPQVKPLPAATPGEKKAIGELSFSMEVTGSYDALKKFIAALEHNIRLVDVQEISFSAPAKPGDLIDLTMKAKTYYQ